jgi:hypothetical protein
MIESEGRVFNKTESRLIRQRQAARARITAILLFALCALFFGITLVKVGYLG